MKVTSEVPVYPLPASQINSQEKPINDYIGTKNLPSISNETAPATSEPIIIDPSKSKESFYAGKISLNLSYSRTEFTEISYQRKSRGESISVKEQLYNKFEATLSIDVSFIAKFEGVHDRVREIDSSVLSKWMSLTEDLLKLEDGGVEAFVEATDELFNEIENAIGMESTALDDMSAFFKDQLNQFISSVKEQVETKRIDVPSESAQAANNDFIPQLLNEIKSSLKDDLKYFINAQFEELIKKFLENQKKDFSLLQIEPQSLIDTIFA